MTKKTCAKDWSGKKYYKLTFIKATDKRQGKPGKLKIIWELQCDCGKIIHAIPYDVTSGNTSSCGCYRRAVAKISGSINGLKRTYDPLISSARAVWAYYKPCSFEKFFELSQQNCFYCGIKPHRIKNVISNSGYNSQFQKDNGDFIYNGLDRIDSSIGHTENNVVPCCWDCNTSKNDMTFEKFIEHIERMYWHTRKFRVV